MRGDIVEKLKAYLYCSAALICVFLFGGLLYASFEQDQNIRTVSAESAPEPVIIIDAGHGGANPGAVYGGRREKDDVLSLALAVGEVLEQSGVDVYYTRVGDVYESPYEKAEEANSIGADLFLSIHRNSSVYPNQYSGVESLVYEEGSEAEYLAMSLNRELEKAGWKNLGVNPRPNLVVLNRTKMPAVLLEVGFINTEGDNERFDEAFLETVQAISDGVVNYLENR